MAEIVFPHHGRGSTVDIGDGLRTMLLGWGYQYAIERLLSPGRGLVERVTDVSLISVDDQRYLVLRATVVKTNTRVTVFSTSVEKPPYGNEKLVFVRKLGDMRTVVTPQGDAPRLGMKLYEPSRVTGAFGSFPRQAPRFLERDAYDKRLTVLADLEPAAHLPTTFHERVYLGHARFYYELPGKE